VTTDLGRKSAQADALVPRPRGAHAATRTRTAGQVAVGQVAVRAAGPVARTRSVAADAVAALVVVLVVPLALLQLPDAIAWAVPGSIAAAGPGAVTSLLRASGLALTTMAAAVPFGALAVRRFRAWPVLLAGLGVTGVADVMGNTARTIAQIGIDRSLHGCGAGVALAAAVALAAERGHPGGTGARGSTGVRGSSAARSSTAARGSGAGRTLAAWWAACAVTGLAAGPELLRYRLGSGDWHAALQPYPWLTGVALGFAALYGLLAEGAVTSGTRTGFPASERSVLALLTAPVVGMCVISVAATFGTGKDVTATAIAAAVSLAGLTIMATRVGRTSCFAVACAVTGFTLAPAAGAASDLMRAAAGPGAEAIFGTALPEAALCGLALCAAVLLGACAAAVVGARHARVVAGCGLLVAAAGFTGGYLTGPRSGLLCVVCVPVAGGLAAALTAGLTGLTAGPTGGLAVGLRASGAPGAPGLSGAARSTGVPGALCGVVLLLTGALAGYLADGAIELRALGDAGTAQASAVQAALTTADLRWNIAAAAVAAAGALAILARRAGAPK
jgi:hypothetical protein